VRPFIFAAHERPQPATNGLDVLQGPPSKLDLGLKRVNIPHRGGREDKAAHISLKTAERGLN
jgi:hypothetical protein